MFAGAYKIFYDHPLSKRKYLVSCYNFTVQHAGKGDLVLQHKAIPFLLCDNGNLWLSLCSVTLPTEKQLGKATITNTDTGELYEYTNGRFVLSDKLVMTDDDLLVLELMDNDLDSEQIAEQLGVSTSTYIRKRQLLFDKLDVKNPAGAIGKAYSMGILNC
jgi:DNA-binding CsgD family transcriptional regulator